MASNAFWLEFLEGLGATAADVTTFWAKLEPERRFLNEPARSKSICASRLVQKTTFSLEF